MVNNNGEIIFEIEASFRQSFNCHLQENRVLTKS